MITPDHTIRTKNWPLIAAGARRRQARRFQATPRATRSRNSSRATAPISQRNNARCNGGQDACSIPLPRVMLVPGLGLFGLGRTQEGRARSPPISPRAAVEAITDAEAIGTFQPIGEADMFDCEYWSLEQAKLGTAQENCRSPARSRSITGAAGAIGAATAQGVRARPAPRWRCSISTLQRGGGAGQGDRRRGARDRLRRDRRGIRARGVRRRWWKRSAASTSWSRTPARPGRAASARSTKRRCARASS